MRNIDLNLLKVLAVLLDTRSTTLAAEKLHTSQPAMSRTLKKLRLLFNDDLLVRNGAEMALTPKAEELKITLPTRLEALYSLTAELSQFDAKEHYGEITIAMNASIAHWLAAPLIQSIAQQAPNVTLRFVDWTQLTPKQLESGQVHYGINYFPMDLAKNLVQKKVGEDRFVFACRKGHPISHRCLQLEDFECYAMAVHVIQDWNDKEEHITRLLKGYALTPKIQLRTTHMNILLQAIKHSDMLFPCSQLLAMQLGEKYTYIEVEEGLPHPEGNFGVVYGLKWRGEKEIQWLDGVINTVIRQYLAKS